MPAVITHNLFGQEAANMLDENILATQEERYAFLLGCQGPDPLFFMVRKSAKAASKVHKLGSLLHSYRVSESLGWMRSSVEHLPQKDAHLGRAYALGYLCHYALDRVAHPYIFGQQYQVIAMSSDLANSGSEVHAIIEADIDSALLWRAFKCSVEQRKPSDFIVFTPRITQVAGALMSQIALASQDIKIATGDFDICCKDMKLFYRVIEPYGSTASRMVGHLERLVRPHSMLRALSHPVVDTDQSPWLNLDHHIWVDPFTQQESTKSFIDLYSEALASWPYMAQMYISQAPIQEITDHLNYSGQELNASENEVIEP